MRRPRRNSRDMTDKDDILALSVRDFTAAAAAKTPTPGGGSVAGVVAALAVALGEMALNFTRGKKKFAEHEPYYARLAERFAKARKMFGDLVADDIQAYQLYQAAGRQDDGPAKAEAVQLATAAAIAVPREMTKLALAILADLRELGGKCNTWLITDLLAAAALAAAAVRLSDYNVRINVPSVADREAGAQIRRASAADLAKALELLDRIEQSARPYLP